MNNVKSKEFTDLRVWQEGHKLVIQIYQLTKKFPDSEKYGLTSQSQRAAVSITSNIAEGFGRKHKAEKLQFYFFALGSLTELKNLILIMKDIELINIKDFDSLQILITSTQSLLRKFISVHQNS